ncbi:MAG: hypothetical protein IKE24_00445 [Clostridia bacterium]|nr:hypothetical protein [Clostridia bacterium]
MLPARRAAALFLAAAFCFAVGMAGGDDPAWPENTAGQRMLKQYVETANLFLIQQGEPGINSLFEAYRSSAVFGITSQPDSPVPEDVEITAGLYENSINTLQVRVSDFSRFPRIAASFIRALTPESMSMQEALEIPTRRMQKAAKSPNNSFEDQGETLNGTVPYIYYAYYPNQYHDQVNWLQMTIVFPMEGYWDGMNILSGSQETKGPDADEDHDQDYEGYDAEDDYVHYEFFVTATPEPDSAAAESYGR